jgi:peptidyl-prolyl cis-trans isomerase B (cyclophilin B)
MRRVVLLAALAAPLLTACGSSTPTATGTSSSPSPESTKAAPTTTLAPVPDGFKCTWTNTGDAAKPVALPPTTVAKTSKIATIRTSVGTLRITLTGAATPCTVASFVSLSLQGFYNDTSCHRMGNMTGFSFLQCGDPTGTGMGGPGYAFADELTGDETYKTGTVAMANSGPDTNGSQFFLVFGDSSFNGPNYTVFGHLDQASIDVLKTVGAKGNDGSGGSSGAPNEKVTFESVTIS